MDCVRFWVWVVIFVKVSNSDGKIFHTERDNQTNSDDSNIIRSRQHIRYRIIGAKSDYDFRDNFKSHYSGVAGNSVETSDFKNSDVTAEILLSEPRRFRQQILNEGKQRRSSLPDTKLDNTNSHQLSSYNGKRLSKKHSRIYKSHKSKKSKTHSVTPEQQRAKKNLKHLKPFIHINELVRYEKHKPRRLTPQHSVNENEFIKSGNKKHAHRFKASLKKDLVSNKHIILSKQPIKKSVSPHHFKPILQSTKHFKVPKPSKITVSGKKTDIALTTPPDGKKRDFTLSEQNKDVLFINTANNTIRIDKPKHTLATQSSYPGPVINFDKDLFDRSAFQVQTTTTVAPITDPPALASILSLQKSTFNSSILSGIGSNIEGARPDFVTTAIIGAQKKCVCVTDECSKNCDKKDDKASTTDEFIPSEKPSVKEEKLNIDPTSAPLSNNYDTPDIENIMNRNKNNKDTVVGDALAEIVNEEALDVLNRFVSESNGENLKGHGIPSAVGPRMNVSEKVNSNNSKIIGPQKSTSNVINDGEMAHDSKVEANNNELTNSVSSGDGEEISEIFHEDGEDIGEEIEKINNNTNKEQSIEVNISNVREENSKANMTKEIIKQLLNAKSLQEEEDNAVVHKKNTFKAIDVDKEPPAVLNKKDDTYFSNLNKVNEDEARKEKTRKTKDAKTQLVKFVDRYRQYMNSFYKRVHKITHDPEFWKNVTKENGSNSSAKRHLVFGKYKPGPLVRAFLKLSPNYKDVLQNALKNNPDPKVQSLLNMTDAYKTVLRNAIQVNIDTNPEYIESFGRPSAFNVLPNSDTSSSSDTDVTSHSENDSEIITKGTVTGSRKDQMIVSEDTDIVEELVKKEKQERADPMKTFLLHLLDRTTDPRLETSVVHHFGEKPMLHSESHDQKKIGSSWNKEKDENKIEEKKMEGSIIMVNGGVKAPVTSSGVQNLTHNDYGSIDLPVEQRESPGLSDQGYSEHEEMMKKEPAFEDEIHQEAEDIVRYDKPSDSEHISENSEGDNSSEVEQKQTPVEHLYEEDKHVNEKNIERKNNDDDDKPKSDENLFNEDNNFNRDDKSVEFEDDKNFENYEQSADPIGNKIKESVKHIETVEQKPIIEHEKPVVEHVYPDNYNKYNEDKQYSSTPEADVEELDQKTRITIEKLKNEKLKDEADELRYDMDNGKRKDSKEQEKSSLNKFMHFEADKSYDLSDDNQNKDEVKYYENQVKLLKKQEKSAFGPLGELAKRVMTPNAQYMKNESIISSALIDEDFPLENSNILKSVPKTEILPISGDVKTSWVRSKELSENPTKKNNTEEESSDIPTKNINTEEESSEIQTKKNNTEEESSEIPSKKNTTEEESDKAKIKMKNKESESNENQINKHNTGDEAISDDLKVTLNDETPSRRIINSYSKNDSQMSRLRNSSLEEIGNETEEQSGDEMKEDVSQKLQNSLEYFGEDESLVNDLSAARNESVRNDENFANVGKDQDDKQENEKIEQSNSTSINNTVATEVKSRNKTKSKQLKETSQLYSITVTSENSNIIGGTFDSNDRDTRDITSETKAEAVNHVLKSALHETIYNVEKGSKRTMSRRKRKKHTLQKKGVLPSVQYQLNVQKDY